MRPPVVAASEIHVVRPVVYLRGLIVLQESEPCREGAQGDPIDRNGAGRLLVSDRYLASTLVLQRLDGVPLDFLLMLNDHAPKPDLAVILTAAPDTIADRITRAGITHRFRARPGRTRPGSRAVPRRREHPRRPEIKGARGRQHPHPTFGGRAPNR
ncbi:hypothetical protein [Streptomyces sp. NPDC096032]|uniref:hypothetical protein n=1 Tax=Streptomyces sp. NPDC096032 TaxID=3366070 RepID=UPI0038284D09